MKNYIIVDGDKIQKTIEKLETGIKTLSLTDGFKDIGKIDALKQILSQSTPLVPELQKTWNAAYINAMSIDEETYKPLFFKDYISNLKLDI